MSNLEQFMQRFVQANDQISKQKRIQPKQQVQQVQKVSNNVIANSGNGITSIKSATIKLSDADYKSSIITLALAHIKKKWSI